MIRIILILSWLLLLPVSLMAEVPKYSNEFLAIGVGARAFGMARSVLAATGDVTAGYWNPAGLTGLEREAEGGLMHAEYFAGLAKYDYGAFAIRLDDRSVAGVSVIRLGADDIPNTLELIDNDGNLRYDRISKFSVADYGFLFSYARDSKIPNLSCGGNVKLIYRKTGDFASAWGFGFDVAGRYSLDRWTFGAVLRDATSTFNAWSFNTDDLQEVFAATGNEIPQNSLELTLPRLLLAGARTFPLPGNFNLLAELDADLLFDGKQGVLVSTSFLNIDPHIGMEVDYKRMVYLRLGMGNMQIVPDFDEKDTFDFQPSLGIGIHWRNFSLDYALTDIADQSIAPYSNVFSFRYGFNLPGSPPGNQR